MASTKSGYLLMEAILAMFILAVVAVPWIGFLRTQTANETLARVDRFFLIKRYFLQALNNPTLKGTEHDQRGKIVIIRSARPDGLTQLQVNLIEKDQTTFNLVGVTR